MFYLKKTFGFGDSVTSLKDAFKQTSITSTPRVIIAKNVTTLEDLFSGCKNLTDISKDIFKFCDKVTEFRGAFYNTKISVIPQGLFDNCINATNLHGVFDCCFSLTTIPQGLFDKCIKVTNFFLCFNCCESLTTIQQGLFDKCPNVTNFCCCFCGCESLTTIPQGLFDKNVNVTNFSNCFEYCYEITSALPDIWNKSKFPKVTNGSSYASGCTKAANYNEIPSNFK